MSKGGRRMCERGAADRGQAADWANGQREFERPSGAASTATREPCGRCDAR
jgi:hypothetical protein